MGVQHAYYKLTGCMLSQAIMAGSSASMDRARLEQLVSDLHALQAQMRRLRSEPAAAAGAASDHDSAIIARKPLRGYKCGPCAPIPYAEPVHAPFQSCQDSPDL